MTLTIKTVNAAFQSRKAVELARILREVADKLEGADWIVNGSTYKLYDVNGNPVGKLWGR